MDHIFDRTKRCELKGVRCSLFSYMWVNCLLILLVNIIKGIKVVKMTGSVWDGSGFDILAVGFNIK